MVAGTETRRLPDVALKSAGKVHLRSPNDNDFNLRYPAVGPGAGGAPGRNSYRRGDRRP